MDICIHWNIANKINLYLTGWFMHYNVQNYTLATKTIRPAVAYNKKCKKKIEQQLSHHADETKYSSYVEREKSLVKYIVEEAECNISCRVECFFLYFFLTPAAFGLKRFYTFLITL